MNTDRSINNWTQFLSFSKKFAHIFQSHNICRTHFSPIIYASPLKEQTLPPFFYWEFSKIREGKSCNKVVYFVLSWFALLKSFSFSFVPCDHL